MPSNQHRWGPQGSVQVRRACHYEFVVPHNVCRLRARLNLFTSSVRVRTNCVCAASLRCAADGERRDCCLTDGVPSILDAISIDKYGGTINQSGLADQSCPDAAREVRLRMHTSVYLQFM